MCTSLITSFVWTFPSVALQYHNWVDPSIPVYHMPHTVDHSFSIPPSSTVTVSSLPAPSPTPRWIIPALVPYDLIENKGQGVQATAAESCPRTGGYSIHQNKNWKLPPLEVELQAGRDICVPCFLMFPQQLEQRSVQRLCSLGVCWVDEPFKAIPFLRMCAKDTCAQGFAHKKGSK